MPIVFSIFLCVWSSKVRDYVYEIQHVCRGVFKCKIARESTILHMYRIF